MNDRREKESERIAINTLPIIVAARNEEKSVALTLASFARAADEWSKQNPSSRAIVILCDNGSTDATRSKVLSSAAALNNDRFEIVLIHEPQPGKLNALRRAIAHLNSLSLNPAAVIFADAEIQWNGDTLKELWNYWRRVEGKADLVGAKIEPNRTGSGNVWGHLDSVSYTGYGEGFQGHGLFIRLAIGMTYLCDAKVLPLFSEIPAEIGNEDLAVSYLVGLMRLHICPSALVKYTECDSMKMFLAVKGRQVQECYRARNWVARRTFSKLPKRSQHSFGYLCCYLRARTELADFVETRPLNIAGAAVVHFKKFIYPKQRLAAVMLAVPAYNFLKLRALFNLTLRRDEAGWLPYRAFSESFCNSSLS